MTYRDRYHPSAARNPYCIAEARYKQGKMHSVEAIGLVLSDPDFKAECALQMRSPVETARAIVLERWRGEVVRKRVVD